MVSVCERCFSYGFGEGMAWGAVRWHSLSRAGCTAAECVPLFASVTCAVFGAPLLWDAIRLKWSPLIRARRIVMARF